MKAGFMALAVLAAISPTNALAAPCPPAAVLTGDPELVETVRGALADRGIAASTTLDCSAIEARLTRQDGALLVALEVGGRSIERRVTDPATAATVIESWTGSGVEAPLLAPVAVRDEAGAETVDPDPPLPAASTKVGAPQLHHLQFFGSAETTLASDDTTWAGGSLGVCVGVGRVCLAVRARYASVVEGSDMWDAHMERGGIDLLFGVDIPFKVWRLNLLPGFAVGMGSVRTHKWIEPMGGIGAQHMGMESGGPRADVHLVTSVPLVGRWALDLTLSCNATQAARFEGDQTADDFPVDPRFLVRAGLGVRYGGP